jgi:uncharacterized protein (DUF433 family)
MATVTYPHVEATPEGVPYIAGTQTKVIEVVLERLAYHWDADEIHRQHPHLSLGQIYRRWRTTTIIRQRWTTELKSNSVRWNRSK